MDPELRALLRVEVQRHAAAAAAGNRDVLLRAIHALKGAFALAGETELAAELGDHDARVREEERGAADRARVFLVALAARLEAGDELAQSTWPLPPPRLRPSAVDPEMRDFYTNEVQDRLLAIDEALDEVDDPVSTLRLLYRHVHSVKGAASAVRDEPMAWFCHGLESRLQHAIEHAEHDAGIREVRRHRRALHGLLHAQAATLDLLRGQADRPGTPTSMPPSRGSVRIGEGAFDALVERVSLLGGLRERDSGIVDDLLALEKEVRDTRHVLADALRLIGPPKPWGASVAAVDRVARAKTSAERVAAGLLRARHSLHEIDAAYAEATRELANLSSSMRRARFSELFRRVEESFRVLAEREGASVTVQTEGGDELVDRRTLDALGPAMVHLARNSIAHGLGPRDATEPRGALAVSLRARRAGNRVILEVEDDGVGADLAELAREAAARGLFPRDADSRQRLEDPSALLALLFFPGFSTSAAASELSGRGLGLDIVAQAVRRLGGTIRLDSAKDRGFRVTLDIPADSGLLPVLWLDSGEHAYGVFASDVIEVGTELRADTRPLDEWLGNPAASPRARIGVRVRAASGREAELGIHGMPRLEHVFVRPLGPLAATFGPFSHAVSRSDGSLRLVLDVPRLVS